MPATHVTPQEHAARARKALLLAEVLRHLECTAADAAVLSDAGWAQAAELAEVNEPSCAARSATIAVLTDREINPDPFTGFPR